MILKSLILTGIIQGFFLIILLNSKRENSTSDKLLMVWLGIISAQLLFYYDNLSFNPSASPILQISGFFLPLISSPVLYLYVDSFSFDHQTQWSKRWIHALPYVFISLLSLFLYFRNPAIISFSNALPIFGVNVPQWLQNIIVSQLAIIPGFYTFLSLRMLFEYQKKLPENYSYTEKVSLNWLKWVIFSLLFIFIALLLLIKFGVIFGYVSPQNLFAVVGVILAFYIFFIGFFGLKQATYFADISTKTNLMEILISKPNYKNSGLNNEKVEELFQKLLIFVDENKPYFNENLSLSTLAQQLGFTPNQLSQIINQKADTNFFNFINGYRVEAVKEKLKDPAFSHYSILAIGYDCGFQSKSSFNKIFKQLVGKTPLEFQKS